MVVRPWVRFVAAFAGLLTVAVVVLGFAGIEVSHVIRAGFRTESGIATARTLNAESLSEQLDEETGIRGYAATGSAVFLEPYRQARPLLPKSLEKLRTALATLGIDRSAAIDDALKTNREWLVSVADPIIASTKNTPAIQRYGKMLVDRYRADIASVDAALVEKERATGSHMQRVITQNVLLTIVSVVLVAVAVTIIVIAQIRAEREFARRDREAAELRAAFSAERRVSDALQEAFLQKPLPALRDVALSAAYVPAGEERKVGGDWYEAVELADKGVMFAIGDVAGHGLEAAVAMNRARQAIVASALRSSDPAKILDQVNRELLGERGPIVTAICGVADAKRFQFTYATAGHPPPVLVEPGREPRLLPYGGVPLGAVSSFSSYQSVTIQTVPGAALVLYTDGATEHSRDPIEGEKLLLDAVRAAFKGDREDRAAAIREHIFGKRTADDDIAILTVSLSASGARAAKHTAERSAPRAEGAVSSAESQVVDASCTGGLAA